MAVTSNVKVSNVIVWKVTWWKNKGPGGAQDHMLSLLKDNEVPFQSQTQKHGRMWAALDEQNYLRLLKKNYGLREIIRTQLPRKVYFDIDCAVNKTTGEMPEDPLEAAKKAICQQFPGARLQISGSRTPQKISYHIIISNWFWSNQDKQKSMVLWALSEIPFVDKCVYSSNQNMKCVNQGKSEDGRIQKILEGSHDIKKHLITVDFDDDARDASDLKWPIESQKESSKDGEEEKPPKTFDLLAIEQLNLPCPEEFDWNESTPLQILFLIPPDKLDHNTTWRVLLWAKGNQITFEEFWSWCQKKDNSNERLQKYYMAWTRGGSWSPNISFIKTILQRFYPDILRDKTINKFLKSQSGIPGTPSKGQWLTKDDLDVHEKFVLLNGPMGTNKTGAVIDTLDPLEKILWITPRISLGYNLEQRIETKGGFEFKNYKKFTKKHENKIADSKHLICCILSLYKTCMTMYDTVVLDEIETMLMMWKGDIGQEYFDLNWNRFMNVLRGAKKVYVMDAFMGEKTINFLKRVDQNRVPRVITGLVPPEERKLITYSCFESWTNKITDDLKAGKNLFIFYPFKTGHGKHKSMESFQKILIGDSGISENDIIWYNADSPDTVKKTLQNVNEVWSNKKCVICNSCITVGVNFDSNHFDRVYAMWEPFVSQRDFFQNMYRCRKLVTNEVHLLSERPRLMQKPWLHAEVKNDDYASLLKDIALEENSKGSIEVFKLFAHQSGFVFIGDGQEIDNSLRKILKKKYDATGCMYKWEKIRDITPEECEELNHQIINSYTENIDAMVCVRKFKFIQDFKPCTPEHVMETLWQTRRFDTLDAIKSQEFGRQRVEDNITRDLFAQNNCKDYDLPEDPNCDCDIKNIQTVFKTQCVGKKHRCNKELMSSYLHAYFHMNVWRAAKKDGKYIMKHDPLNPKRKYVVFETNPKFKAIVTLFLKYLDMDYGVEKPHDIDCCLIQDYF